MQIILRLRIALILLAFTALLGLLSSPPSFAGKTTDAPALRSIAFEHYLSGDSDAALDYYQKAVDTASREYGADSSYIAQLYYEMGTLALDAKKFLKSESYLQKAVQHNPNSIMARVKFAELLQLRGKNDEALQQIQAALAKHSGSPEAREALVIWLQSNKKMARAIHESYNLSVAANGVMVPPPVPVLAKQAEPTVLAAAIPAAPAVVLPISPKSPLKLFPWMTEKKPEAKKPDETKKAEDKSSSLLHRLSSEKKPIEVKKPEKKASKKEPKQPKSAKEKPVKEKPAKHAKSKESKTSTESQVELRAAQAALRTTAKALPKKKDSKKDDGSDPAESGGSESKADETAAAPAEPKAKAKKEPAPKMVQMAMPQFIQASKPSKRSNTMVPPPPPMVPVFGGPMGFPPQQFHQQPPKQAKAKPKESAPAVKEPAAETKSASSTGGSDDPEFILEWAGAKDKKKKAK